MIQLLVPAPDAGRGLEDGPATARPAVAGGASQGEMFGGDSRGRRILVVDDFPDSAYSLSLALAWAGFQTRAASDGHSALTIVEAWRPDVAILELALPGMDGFELARRLRGGPEGHDLLLIAYTGFNDRAYRRLSKAAGFDDYFLKPVSVDLLAASAMGAGAGRLSR